MLFLFNLDLQICHAIIIFVLKLYAYIDSSLIYYVHNVCVEKEINELNWTELCNKLNFLADSSTLIFVTLCLMLCNASCYFVEYE